MNYSTKGRRAVTLTAAAATLALTAGCAGSEGSTSSDGPVDLRMTVWSSNDAHHEIFNTIAESYIEENPDLVSSVSFDAMPADTYVDALTTQIAGGEAPDLAWIMESYAAQFVESGVFADLTPAFSDAEGYEMDDLIPGAVELWSTDGNVYGYPFSNSPFGVYVNLDLLDQIGRENPRDLIASGDWTYDELMEIASDVSAETEAVGFQAHDDPYSNWNGALGQMWLAWGAAPWSEDGAQCQFTDPEVVEFFEWLHPHIFDRGAMPLPGEEFDFASGQVGLLMSQLSASTGLGDDFEWDFLPLPSGPTGHVPVVGQGGVGVIAQSSHPDVAADFLAYFTNPENTRLLAQYFPPPRSSLLTVDALADAAPDLTDEQLQTTVIDQSAAAVTKMGHPQMSEIADPVRIALDSLWVPDADVAGVLAEVCADIEPIISGS